MRSIYDEKLWEYAYQWEKDKQIESYHVYIDYYKTEIEWHQSKWQKEEIEQKSHTHKRQTQLHENLNQGATHYKNIERYKKNMNTHTEMVI